MEPEVCCQCGGQRSLLSGKRCRSCYRLNAKRRRDGSPEGQVIDALLEGERLGVFEQSPGDYWKMNKWHVKQRRHAHSGDGKHGS